MPPPQVIIYCSLMIFSFWCKKVTLSDPSQKEMTESDPCIMLIQLYITGNSLKQAIRQYQNQRGGLFERFFCL